MRDLLPEVDIPVSLLFSTPFMVILFCGIVWWVYRKDRKKVYEDIQDIPLEN